MGKKGVQRQFFGCQKALPGSLLCCVQGEIGNALAPAPIAKPIGERNDIHPYPLEQGFHLLSSSRLLEVRWGKDSRLRRYTEFGNHALETSRQIEVEKACFTRVHSKTMNAPHRNVCQSSGLCDEPLCPCDDCELTLNHIDHFVLLMSMRRWTRVLRTELFHE